jgi:tetratricopeptide (TPR) repeat protein
MSPETLTRAASLAVLRRLAPRLDDEPDAALDAIARRLHDAPAALDLAGRYLHDHAAMPPGDYVAALDSAEALRAHPGLHDWAKGNPAGPAAGLAAAFALAWQRLAGDNPIDVQARRAFLLAGRCVPGAPIPPELFARALAPAGDVPPGDDRRLVFHAWADTYGLNLLGDVGPPTPAPAGLLDQLRQRLSPAGPEETAAPSDTILDAGLRRLANRGLLAERGPGLAIDPTLGHFASLLATEAPPAEAPSLLPLAGALAELLFQANGKGDLERCALLRPHAALVLPLCEKEDPRLAARLWNNLGTYLRIAKALPTARTCLERALAMDEQAHGPEHPDVCLDLNNIGTLLQEMGDGTQARQYLERALDVGRRVCAPGDPDLVIILVSLGLLLLRERDLAAARPHLERALHLAERARGATGPPLVATALGSLGLLREASGDLERAERCFARALSIKQGLFGRQHPVTVADRGHLARVWQKRGNLSRARRQLENARQIEEQAYGPAHPKVVNRLNDLALVLRAQGKRKEARQHLEQALETAEQIYGPNHPAVAICLNNLGRTLHELDDLEGARDCLERAVEIDGHARQRAGSGIVAALHNLGAVLSDLGDYRAARQHYERALPLAEAAYGKWHSEVGLLHNSLGCLLAVLDEPAEARPHFERALQIYRTWLPARHPTMRKIQANLKAVTRPGG